MQDIKQYIEENKDRFLEELFELIRIPSISSDEQHMDDMRRASEQWKIVLLQAGVDYAKVMETEGHPVVFAEKKVAENAPTILVYGHTDVMPVDPLELWNTDPFEPVIKNEKIWGRGADDDKGQAFMHAKAFEFLVKTNQLKCNVKFLIEGEEEIGSPNLPEFCENNKELLKADVILVSDTTMLSSSTPSITTGLRGLAYWQIDVTGPERDLHSGMFGGAVANPINILSKMIGDLIGENGQITIPGFYDDVLEVGSEERKLMSKTPFDEDHYKRSIGVDELKGEKGFSVQERTGIRPSLDACGIWGGYTGEGAKTILPSKAHAKLSARLVPHQDHQKIAEQFKEYFELMAPPSVKVEVSVLHGGQAYVCPIDTPAYRAAEKAFLQVYGSPPVPIRSGGSIPIISKFEQILGVKSVLMGFGLSSDAIHSPNENFPLEQFFKGIETIPYFYKYYEETSINP
jgi:acetylornithine deacetylase/succinyl-diaminopimelate desuccinylase-like protein